jgi:hypothetical protein
MFASQITLSRTPRANARTCGSMDIRPARTRLIAADYEAVIAKPSIPSGKAKLTLICRIKTRYRPIPLTNPRMSCGKDEQANLQYFNL